MSIKLVIISTPRLTREIKKVWREIKNLENIEIVERVLLDEDDSFIKQFEVQDNIGAIIAGGYYLEVLRQYVSIPVVGFSVTSFDLLKAILKAREKSGTIAIISYKKGYSELQQIQELLKVEIRQVVYNSSGDLASKIKEIKKEGINAIIGSSYVCNLAEEHGMNGYLVYSREAILQAIEKARELVISRQREIEKSERLKAILDFAYGGIIATDEKGLLTVFNPIAEKLTGINSSFALGKPVEQIIPNTRISKVIESGQPEINQLHEIGGVHIFTNYLPIVVKGNVCGAVATFQDIDTIKEAEAKIRRILHSKGLCARNTFEDIVGKSVNMRKAVSKAKSFSKSQSTILIYGETGTGKELFAQGIHNYSDRRNRPFVAVNCAALPESLLESELFGYEEGAFTGARRGGKPGLFELAHLGTMFLDEISEMPLNVQARLLRVLQEKEIMRIGSDKVSVVDIRIVAATNQDLWRKVQAGSFREDLYYRLNVLKLVIPPLRERMDDIHLLVTDIIRSNVSDLDLQKDIVCYVPLMVSNFKKLYWPGNVRQMESVVKRIITFFTDHPGECNHNEFIDSLQEAIVDVIPLNENLMLSRNLKTSNKSTIPVFNKDISDYDIMTALKRVNGNKSKAAEILGISRMTLWRRLKKGKRFENS